MGSRNNKEAARRRAYALEEMAALMRYLFAIFFLSGGQLGLCFRQQFFNELPFFSIGLDRQYFAVVIDVETSDEFTHRAIPRREKAYVGLRTLQAIS
jgi:hypothetical protein